MDLDNALASFASLAPLLLNPGEAIIVVHNLAAFVSRYGTGFRVVGEFTGSLDNAGERLTLTGPLGEPILDFSYDPTWYPLTDGGGFSLVAVNPNALPGAWGLAQNWRPSSGLGGSPGIADPPPPAAVLTVALTPGKALGLAWPVASGNFELYSTTALDCPSQWIRVTNAPALLADQWVVDSDLPTNRACFYRLQGQSYGGP